MQLGLLLARQNIMRRVLLSLLPIYIFCIYAFGWRLLVVLAFVTICGVGTEYVILRFMQGSVPIRMPEAILVSCALYTLVLPPAVPLWTACLGIIFGVLFGKGIFGGFGKNVFNPALLGRCFVFITFPAVMTVNWSEPFRGFPGGLLRYSGGADVLTSATPLVQVGGEQLSLLRLFFGPIPGSAGEISAFLILLAAVYLVLTKTASLEIMLASAGAFLGLSTLYYLTGAAAASPLMSIFSGGALFAFVFMATDPITAPTNRTAKILYGLLIGALTITIRTFANFREGAMFAVLLGNSFAPLLDLQVKEFMARRREATS